MRVIDNSLDMLDFLLQKGAELGVNKDKVSQRTDQRRDKDQTSKQLSEGLHRPIYQDGYNPIFPPQFFAHQLGAKAHRAAVS